MGEGGLSGLTKIKSLDEWPKMRKEIESAVTSVIGKVASNGIELQVKTVDEMEFPGYVRRRVNYFVDDWTRVSAWLFVPDGKEDFPAVLCFHGRNRFGKDEAAGLEGDSTLAFAKHFAERGYVTLAPDCITAGERISSGLDAFDTASFYKENPQSSLVGKMLADHMRSIDALMELSSVDGARIGVIGHDLGAYNALFLAAFDERVRGCVASCGITSVQEDDNPARWIEDDGLVLCPKLSDAIAKKKFPFDWDQIIALAAPSPILLITALNDSILSNTKSCEAVVKRARKIYKFLGAQNALVNFTHRDGHKMSADAMEAADEWLERWV